MTTRRPATVREAKALAHPLRLRILRLCLHDELTNKQLADRLERDPGTVLHHVRHLVAADLLEPAPVRTGASGALEKPYRSSGRSWWLELGEQENDHQAPLTAFTEELRAAGPDAMVTFARFSLRLSAADLAELDRRIVAVLDEFVATDDQRADQPRYGGLLAVHKLAE